MATVLTGDTEIKRIFELLEKTLTSGELSSYNVAIDKQGEADTKRVPLDKLLAFASLASSFYDSAFKLLSAADDDELTFSLENLTANREIALPDISGLLAVAGMLNAFSYGGQAHGGSYVKAFSATATFDANDGNNQEMIVTASTTIAIENELPGTYIITLEIDSGAAPTINIDASIGTPVDNNATIINADNDINIITLVVRPNGTKYYTINTITA